MNWKHLVAIVAGLGLNLFLIGPIALDSAWRGQGDFAQFYIGAQLGHSRYDFPAVKERQTEIFGTVRPALVPTRLPFYYGALWPLGRLPYRTALILWTVLMGACGIAAVWWYAPKQRGAVGVAAAFSPLLTSVVWGQDVALLSLILAAGLRLRRDGHLVAAGVVLSLLSIKFQLFLLLPVAFLMLREFAVLRGALFGGVGLALASFGAGGMDWPIRYLDMLRNPLMIAESKLMPNLHGMLSGHVAWEWMAAALIAGLAIHGARRRAADAVPIFLLTGFLVSVHAFSADSAILFSSLLWFFQRRRSLLALICLTPIPASYALLGYGGVFGALLCGALAESVFKQDPREGREPGWQAAF